MSLVVAMPLALWLAGCARDTRPAAIANPEPQTIALQPVPDLRRFIAERIDEIFAKGSSPQNIQISGARPTQQGGRPAWTVCVRASLTVMTGRRTPQRTYLIVIQDQQIVDRRPATAETGCARERYERIARPNPVELRPTPSTPPRRR